MAHLPIILEDEAALVVEVPFDSEHPTAKPGSRRRHLDYEVSLRPHSVSQCSQYSCTTSSGAQSPAWCPRSSRESTPEAGVFGTAAFFQFKLLPEIKFGCGEDCDVRFPTRDGISKHHYSLIFTEYDSWMLVCHSKQELHMDNVRLAASQSRAVNPNFEEASYVCLTRPGPDLCIYTRWSLLPPHDFARKFSRMQRVTPPQPMPVAKSRPSWMANLRFSPIDLLDEYDRYWVVRDMCLASKLGARAIRKSSGEGCAAIYAEDGAEFAHVAGAVLCKVSTKCRYLSPLLDVVRSQRVFIEPYFGTAQLDSISPSQACLYLIHLNTALGELHGLGMCHGTINKDCIIITDYAPDASESFAVLTQIWRHVARTGAVLECTAANKAKDRKDLARVMLAALNEGNESEVPLSWSMLTRDPILCEVLKWMLKGHDTGPYIRDLPPETLFDTIWFTQKSNIRVTKYNWAQVSLNLEDLAQLARRHAYRQYPPDSKDMELLKRLEHMNSSYTGIRLRVLRKMIRPYVKTLGALMEQLDELPEATSFTVPISFKVSCLPQSGLINITQFQAATRLELPQTALYEHDLEVLGDPKYEGLYVPLERFNELTSDVAYRCVTELPHRKNDSQCAKMLRSIDPRRYMFLATGCPWTALVPVERQAPLRANLEPFCKTSLGTTTKPSLTSYKDMISLCQKYRLEHAKSALEAFATRESKARPEKFYTPPSPEYQEPSGSDTDIASEEDGPEEKIQFKRSEERPKRQGKVQHPPTPPTLSIEEAESESEFSLHQRAI